MWHAESWRKSFCQILILRAFWLSFVVLAVSNEIQYLIWWEHVNLEFARWSFRIPWQIDPTKQLKFSLVWIFTIGRTPSEQCLHLHKRGTSPPLLLSRTPVLLCSSVRWHCCITTGNLAPKTGPKKGWVGNKVSKWSGNISEKIFGLKDSQQYKTCLVQGLQEEYRTSVSLFCSIQF